MIINFLNKPFPGTGFSYKSVLNNFLVGCFVATFLIIFQPFEINLWQTDNRNLKLAGYGLVSFIAPMCVTLSIHFLIPQRFKDNWTVWKEITALVTILVCVAIGNLLYSNLLGNMRINLNGFIAAFLYTIVLGIFPIGLHVITRHNRLLRINDAKARVINEQLHKENPVTESKPENVILYEPVTQITLRAENEKDEIKLEANNLLYIESADNYSNVIFLHTGTIKRQMIRSSLKRLELQLTIETIQRCHRTFIVNLNNVINIEGNAAGYKLSVKNTDVTIPVSRNYAPQVLEQLKSLK